MLDLRKGTYTVWYDMDYGFAGFTVPIAVGVDYDTAKAIQKHWNKFTTDVTWNGTGDYVHMSSREFCTNIADFEDGKPVGYIDRSFKVDSDYLYQYKLAMFD